jgi:predicted LPLAT superfamily acyltransferase
MRAEAPSADWLNRRERGSGRLLAWMVRLSLRFGRRASRAALHLIVVYFFLFAPAARRASRRYLTLALGVRPRARDLYRHILYFATCVHDRVYLINEQYARFDFSIEGEELVRAALDSGRGAFLMGAHLGSFEVMRSIGLRQPSIRVSMAMYEHNARKLNAVLASINPAVKADIISLGQVDAMLKIAERLDGGAFVGMLADRTLGEEPLQAVSLLGAGAHLPTGPMRIAAALRRPVIFMAGLYRGRNRYHVVFASLADFTATTRGGRETAVTEAIERYAALLERYCRSDPYNWFNFFDFWRAPAAQRKP